MSAIGSMRRTSSCFARGVGVHIRCQARRNAINELSRSTGSYSTHSSGSPVGSINWKGPTKLARSSGVSALMLSLSQCGAMLKRGGMSLHIVPTFAKMVGCLLPSRHHLVFGNPTLQALAGIAGAAEQGKLVPTIGRIVPLSEAISAVVELERTGSPKGKLVIAPTLR
jgi:NADPH:quinone reductase-like Zn-dependent oxidoreductase